MARHIWGWGRGNDRYDKSGEPDGRPPGAAGQSPLGPEGMLRFPLNPAATPRDDGRMAPGSAFGVIRGGGDIVRGPFSSYT